MNTQVNRRLLFSPAFVTLSVAVVVMLAMLALGSPSVQAQTTSVVDSSITIATNGTVTDSGTTVTVTGSVTIKCRRVIDTTTATSAPIVMLDFDFSLLQGTTGSGKNLRTYVTGGNHATELRPLQASDTIVVTVPYFDRTQDALSASSFMATANLNFDISTGRLTSGSLVYGTNVFASTGVGSITAN